MLITTKHIDLDQLEWQGMEHQKRKMALALASGLPKWAHKVAADYAAAKKEVLSFCALSGLGYSDAMTVWCDIQKQYIEHLTPYMVYEFWKDEQAKGHT